MHGGTNISAKEAAFGMFYVLRRVFLKISLKSAQRRNSHKSINLVSMNLYKNSFIVNHI